MSGNIKGCILAIDDNPMVIELLVKSLSTEGYEIDTAGNGLEGLKMLDVRQYALIISDIDMPVMNGMEFYSKLIEKTPSMKQKVIFITGHRDAARHNFIKEAGCVYLDKPFRIDELCSAVNEICGFKHPRC